MQDFVDGRRTFYCLYSNTPELTSDEVGWLAEVDTSKVTSAYRMFSTCKLLTEVPLFDLSGMSTTEGMFYYCSALSKLPKFNLSNVPNVKQMFYYCESLTKSPPLDLSSATSTKQMFYYCKALTEVGELSNTGNITEFYGMFYGCKNLTEAPYLDLSRATTLYELFGNTGLTSVPPLDYSKATEASRIFYGCPIENAEISVDNATSIEYLFCGERDDETLKTARILKTSKVTSMQGLFSNREGLQDVYIEDMRNVTNAYIMFQYCFDMRSFYTKNIKTTLTIGGSAPHARRFTVDNLVSLLYELRETDSIKTLTIGTEAVNKLANVYVREIPITDAMREADDLIDEKLPFERCESTADGATLITDYVLLKNWKLA
jgi:hypothetical protein